MRHALRPATIEKRPRLEIPKLQRFTEPQHTRARRDIDRKLTFLDERPRLRTLEIPDRRMHREPLRAELRLPQHRPLRHNLRPAQRAQSQLLDDLAMP